LRLFLKAVTVSDDRMSTGRLFHASGPATANARLSNLTRVLGTRRSPSAERSDCRVDTVATGILKLTDRLQESMPIRDSD